MIDPEPIYQWPTCDMHGETAHTVITSETSVVAMCLDCYNSHLESQKPQINDPSTYTGGATPV